jgi:hypothetical protein
MAPERSKKKITAKITTVKQVVNTVTSYEIIIAAKLAQMPVPDMADSIWADIAAQLDAPLPEDDGHEPPQPQPGPGLPGLGKGFFFVAVTAIVITALWFYAGKKSRTKENIQPQQVVPAAVSTDTAAGNQSTAAPRNGEVTPVQAAPGKKTAITAFDTANRLALPVDQPIGIDRPVINPDSAVLQNNRVKLKPDSAAMVPAPPKPKGVKGISDNDYKIKGEKKIR